MARTGLLLILALGYVWILHSLVGAVPDPAKSAAPRRDPPKARSPANAAAELLTTFIAPLEDAVVAAIPPRIRFEAWPKVALYPSTLRGCSLAPNGKELAFDDRAREVSFVARIVGRPMRVSFDPRAFERGDSGTRLLMIYRDGTFGGYYPGATRTRVPPEDLAGERPAPLVIRKTPL